MTTESLRVDVVDAAHHIGVNQSVVQLRIDRGDAEGLLCGFVHVEFFTYVPADFDREHNPERGEIPLPPDWYRARYANLGTPDDFVSVVERVGDLQQSDQYARLVDNPEVAALGSEITGNQAGYILATKVADTFEQVALQPGENVVILDRVFPNEREPWHYLRISVNDAHGMPLVTMTWTPW